MTDPTIGDYTSVTCPMPSCRESLYLDQNRCYGISVGDLRTRPRIEPGDDHTTTWQVVCGQGHVVLLPEDDGDDTHEFEPEHWTQLVDLLAQLAPDRALPTPKETTAP